MFLKIEKNCSVKIYNRLLNKNNIFLEVKILKIKSHLGVINFVIPNFLKIVKHSNFLILCCDNKFFLKSFSTIFKNSFLGGSRGGSSKIVIVGIAHKVKYNAGTRVLSLRLGFKYLLNFKIPTNIIVRCPGKKKKNI
jgi:ribosomal protein L6P/L9E